MEKMIAFTFSFEKVNFISKQAVFIPLRLNEDTIES